MELDGSRPKRQRTIMDGTTLANLATNCCVEVLNFLKQNLRITRIGLGLLDCAVPIPLHAVQLMASSIILYTFWVSLCPYESVTSLTTNACLCAVVTQRPHLKFKFMSVLAFTDSGFKFACPALQTVG
jgi:hypothetical protein